jgi:hypothetical protein
MLRQNHRVSYAMAFSTPPAPFPAWRNLIAIYIYMRNASKVLHGIYAVNPREKRKYLRSGLGVRLYPCGKSV